MKFIVDLQTCENHGQCIYVAPQFFTLDEDGKLSLRQQATDEYISGAIDDDSLEDVQEAADSCPVQAIRLEV